MQQSQKNSQVHSEYLYNYRTSRSIVNPDNLIESQPDMYLAKLSVKKDHFDTYNNKIASDQRITIFGERNKSFGFRNEKESKNLYGINDPTNENESSHLNKSEDSYSFNYQVNLMPLSNERRSNVFDESLKSNDDMENMSIDDQVNTKNKNKLSDPQLNEDTYDSYNERLRLDKSDLKLIDKKYNETNDKIQRVEEELGNLKENMIKNKGDKDNKYYDDISDIKDRLFQLYADKEVFRSYLKEQDTIINNIKDSFNKSQEQNYKEKQDLQRQIDELKQRISNRENTVNNNIYRKDGVSHNTYSTRYATNSKIFSNYYRYKPHPNTSIEDNILTKKENEIKEKIKTQNSYDNISHVYPYTNLRSHINKKNCHCNKSYLDCKCNVVEEYKSANNQTIFNTNNRRITASPSQGYTINSSMPKKYITEYRNKTPYKRIIYTTTDMGYRSTSTPLHANRSGLNRCVKESKERITLDEYNSLRKNILNKDEYGISTKNNEIVVNRKNFQ